MKVLLLVIVCVILINARFIVIAESSTYRTNTSITTETYISTELLHKTLNQTFESLLMHLEITPNNTNNVLVPNNNSDTFIETEEKLSHTGPEKNSDELVNTDNTTLNDNNEDLFGITDNPNVTTEFWNEVHVLQNTSVEEIFNSTEYKDEIFNNQTSVVLDQIIQLWLQEQQERQHSKSIQAIDLFVEDNSTKPEKENNKTYDTFIKTEMTTETVNTELSVTQILTTLQSTQPPYDGVTTESAIFPTTTTDLISLTTNSSEDNEPILDGGQVMPNIFGSLHNMDRIASITLNCSIQIFINETPLVLPHNLTIEESADNKHGYMKFVWVDNLNNSLSILFIVESQKEYYYIDTCKIYISNLAAFQEDTQELNLEVEAFNLDLFKTKVGTTLKIDQSLILPLKKGVTLYFHKVQFGALQPLFGSSKQSFGATFSNHFVVVSGIIIALIIFCILLVFICKRYISSIINKKM